MVLVTSHAVGVELAVGFDEDGQELAAEGQLLFFGEDGRLRTQRIETLHLEEVLAGPQRRRNLRRPISRFSFLTGLRYVK